MLVQYLSLQLPYDDGHDAQWSPPGNLLLDAENLITGAGGVANGRWATVAADQSWQQHGGAHGKRHVWHRPSRVYGLSGSSFSTSAHEPPWISTAGSSSDPSPTTGYGNAPQQTQTQQHRSPTATASSAIEACHQRSRALQSQWKEEQDEQHRALLARQASQTAAILNAEDKAQEEMQRRLSLFGKERTQATATSAAAVPSAAASATALSPGRPAGRLPCRPVPPGQDRVEPKSSLLAAKRHLTAPTPRPRTDAASPRRVMERNASGADH